jgi:O-antigen ligase
MLESLKRNSQFLAMLAIWVFTGMAFAPAGLLVVAVSVILLKWKGRYAEMIIGLIFILILSDSRQYQLDFAKQVKDVYLVLLTALYLFDRKNFNFSNSTFLSFTPFLAWSFAMTFRSPDMMVAFQKTLSYALLYFTVPAYFVKAFRENGPGFLKDFTMIVALLMVIGLLLIVLNPQFVFLAGRFTGVLGNPNGLGIFVVLALILVVCTQIKFPDLFTKNELILVYFLLGLSAILTGSRNTIMCITLFLGFTRFYKMSYWYGFMTVILAILLYQIVFSNLPSILQALGLAEALRADSLESGSGRLVAWIFALNRINSDLNLFLMGNGFSFDEMLYQWNYRTLSAMGHQGGVHNTFLALWLNTGIIGLLLWAVGFFRIIFKAVTISYTALPLMYTVLFSAFFEAWLMGSLNPYHIMFLFTITLLVTANEEFGSEAKPAPTLYQSLPLKQSDAKG